jgi:hypothetical protein
MARDKQISEEERLSLWPKRRDECHLARLGQHEDLRPDTIAELAGMDDLAIGMVDRPDGALNVWISGYINMGTGSGSAVDGHVIGGVNVLRQVARGQAAKALFDPRPSHGLVEGVPQPAFGRQALWSAAFE